MVISVRVSDEDGYRMKAYADREGLTVSALLRNAVQERLENTNDLTEQELEVVREKTRYNSLKRKQRKKAKNK